MAETIAAISTAPGEAGIGIVRVSGPQSEALMRRIMFECPEEIEPRHAYFGKVVKDSSDKEAEVIDEAVFLFMKGPASYTGEDMLEVQAHGSNVSLKSVLSAILGSGLEGVRMAEPGEFTKLAFLNGKMDLSQAEAVIDIIKAKSDLSLGIAEGQRAGRLSESIQDIRSALLDVLAQMAVDIDYPDEDYDTDAGAYSEIINQLRWVQSDVDELLDTVSIGRIAREGVRAVIAGKPNAGKSTLLSRLSSARPEIASYPFTTKIPNLGRVQIDFDHGFFMADIPGLIEGASQGVGLGHEFLRHIERAGIIVHLVEPDPMDGTTALDNYKNIRKELELYKEELCQRPEILVVTKAELPGAQDVQKELEEYAQKPVLLISSVTGQGLNELKRVIGKELQKAKETPSKEEKDVFDL